MRGGVCLPQLVETFGDAGVCWTIIYFVLILTHAIVILLETYVFVFVIYVSI